MNTEADSMAKGSKCGGVVLHRSGHRDVVRKGGVRPGCLSRLTDLLRVAIKAPELRPTQIFVEPVQKVM